MAIPLKFEGLVENFFGKRKYKDLREGGLLGESRFTIDSLYINQFSTIFINLLEYYIYISNKEIINIKPVCPGDLPGDLVGYGQGQKYPIPLNSLDFAIVVKRSDLTVN